MGSSSDAEPMREGELIWAKRSQPVIAEGKRRGDREEEIKDSHSTP
jgi:hypothetical protein